MDKDIFVLGIACFYHDSSASLLKNGKVVAAAAEERFTRKKHDNSFPVNAVRYCLESQKITIQDVSHLAFYEKPLLKFERLMYQYLHAFPLGFASFLSAMPSWLNEKLRVAKIVRKRLKYGGDIFFIPHHLAHAASSYLTSPFSDSAIVTADGVGEWATTTIGIGDGNNIKILKEIDFPSSLGLLYSTITAYLGFSVNESEYKVMGLSAYGETDPHKNSYYKSLKQVIDVKEDGSFRLNMSYFSYHWAQRMPGRKMHKLLGGPSRKPGGAVTKRHQDIAAALQILLEEVMTKILNHAHKVTGLKNLSFAGGVALNSLYNGKILSRTNFKDIWIQPDPGDGGTSLGAAAYVYFSILGKGGRKSMDTAYLGPEYSNREIERFLEKEGIKHYKFKDDAELTREVAGRMYDNQVIGWFQGRMEWGPRALGGRSILANPLNPSMKEILNVKVKRREEFRPFAPVVPRNKAGEIFHCDSPLPRITDYMLMVYPTRDDWQSKIPSVVHVDGSARLQTINRESNPLYHDLLDEFANLSGVPVLINTSFNVRGEPIVCTPKDAYNCFTNTEIDCLIMGRFLITKS